MLNLKPGCLLKLKCDTNTPNYPIDCSINTIFGSYTEKFDRYESWRRFFKNDIFLFVSFGRNLGKVNESFRLTSFRNFPNTLIYGSDQREKIELHFIFRENFVTFVLSEKDLEEVFTIIDN